jgi:hypothetical protein
MRVAASLPPVSIADATCSVDEYFPDKKLASALMFVDWVAQSVEVGSVISWHVA